MTNQFRFVLERGKIFICFFLAASFFLGCVFSVNAQGAPGTDTERQTSLRLTPETAVDMAIKNNLMLEMARLGADIKYRKARFVWNEFLPTFTATGTLARSNWPISSIPQWNLLGSLQAELYLSFAIIPGIRSFLKEYEAGRITFEKAKLQMEQGVRKMYNGILLLEANVALLNDSYKNAIAQANMAEANFRAGLAPRLVWLQAQVAVENMKPSINDLENTLKDLKGNFALLLGMSFDAAFDLEPIALNADFIPPDMEEFIARAASGKPDIKELQANIVTMLTQQKAARLQAFTPFILFNWTMSALFDPTLDPLNENWFTQSNWIKGGTGGAGGAFSITVGVSINSLFPFTKEGQQRKDLAAGIQIQNIALAQMIRETELEVFTKINSLEKIRASKDAQQATVNMAEQSYRLTLEAYRAGLQDFQSVQNARLASDQAKVQLLTQQFNYSNDLIDLEYSIGVPFGTLSGNKGSEK